MAKNKWIVGLSVAMLANILLIENIFDPGGMHET
jgi:hypothetical protein